MRTELKYGWVRIDDQQRKISVTLPEDPLFSEERNEMYAGGINNAFFPGKSYHYQRILKIPAAELQDEFSLHFEGVYGVASVYLNHILLLTNHYGYTDFDAVLTGKLSEGENVIDVIADNTLIPNARWYNGAGICRPVFLVHRKCVDILSVKVVTLQHDPIEIQIDIQSRTEASVLILDQGRTIYQGKPGRISLTSTKLWSIDEPNLYHLIVRAGDDEEELDFGIRTIELLPSQGLLLNGKAIKLRGGCIHLDNGILGAADYPEASQRKVHLLKEAGFNAIRSAHQPLSESLLRECDKQGLLVVDEAFDGWYIPKTYHDHSRYFETDYHEVLRRMVRKDFNHPSVILYSLGNEVTEVSQKKGLVLMKEMRDEVKKLDPTRPITCGINLLIALYAKFGFGIYKENKNYQPLPLKETKKRHPEKKSGSSLFNFLAGRLQSLFSVMSRIQAAGHIATECSKSLDILGLNYGSSRFPIDARKHKERMMLGTESLVKTLPDNWKMVEEIPNLIGDFIWAAYDYLGESGFGAWLYPSEGGLPLSSGSGTLDLLGHPDAEMAFLRRVWGLEAEPYLGVRPLIHPGEVMKKSAWRFTNAVASYTFPGHKGEKTTAEVYSKGSYAELYQNGRLLQKKKIRRFKAQFNIRYLPGALKTVVYDEQKRRVGEVLLMTGHEKQLRARLEEDRIKIGGLVFLDICLEDENYALLPLADDQVTLRFDSSCLELLGFGSSKVRTSESFRLPYHTAYQGRLLACFRGLKEGDHEICIEAEGMSQEKVLLEVVPDEIQNLWR